MTTVRDDNDVFLDSWEPGAIGFQSGVCPLSGK
jgi:hypothetical protein